MSNLAVVKLRMVSCDLEASLGARTCLQVPCVNTKGGVLHVCIVKATKGPALIECSELCIC